MGGRLGHAEMGMPSHEAVGTATGLLYRERKGPRKELARWPSACWLVERGCAVSFQRFTYCRSRCFARVSALNVRESANVRKSANVREAARGRERPR
eukprot:4658430-Prymnesium_polylepis.2